MIRNPFDSAVFNWHWTTPTTSGAGNDLTIDPIPNARAELVLLSFQFSADANAANRWIRFIAIHGVYDIMLGGSDYVITANQTRQIIIGQHGHTTMTAGGDVLYIAIPSFPFILENDSLYTRIQNIQATDECTNPCVAWKIWTFEQ